jgi:hypothetical protein
MPIESLLMYNRGKCFSKIIVKNLIKTLYNKMGFVFVHTSICIIFNFEDTFVGDKKIYLLVME